MALIDYVYDWISSWFTSGSTPPWPPRVFLPFWGFLMMKSGPDPRIPPPSCLNSGASFQWMAQKLTPCCPFLRIQSSCLHFFSNRAHSYCGIPHVQWHKGTQNMWTRVVTLDQPRETWRFKWSAITLVGSTVPAYMEGTALPVFY